VQVRYLGPAPRLTGAPEVAPEPSAPIVEARASAGVFVVQVGAFANPANAERVRTALSGEGEVLLDRREVAGGTLHRVRLGGWATRAEAEAARVRVAELGFAGAVVAAR
jgi:cell division protein FtsN